MLFGALPAHVQVCDYFCKMNLTLPGPYLELMTSGKILLYVNEQELAAVSIFHEIEGSACFPFWNPFIIGFLVFT